MEGRKLHAQKTTVVKILKSPLAGFAHFWSIKYVLQEL